MSQQGLYSIGKVSKICDVSQRMLRYYEEVGLIEPDKIAEPSHYRYYSVQTMQQVQNIRYLIDQGFSLDEIKVVLSEDNLDRFQALFCKRSKKRRTTWNTTASDWPACARGTRCWWREAKSTAIKTGRSTPAMCRRPCFSATGGRE